MPDRPPDAPSDAPTRHLDGGQLVRLAASLRGWMDAAERPADRHARGRLWLVFLVLRFTGARLGEVLSLDDRRDIDLERGLVRFSPPGGPPREAPLPDEAVSELRAYLQGRLSPIEMPKKIILRAEPLPKTAVGKLSKRDLLVQEGLRKP